MNTQRVLEEKNYWNECAKDPEVDKKYISDLTDQSAWDEALGNLTGLVMEIGCGVGRLMKPGWYGTDISSEMLKIARRRRPSCHFRICDGRSVPYKEGFFDAVYCVLVFQHIPIEGVSRYIEEAHRVLKKGGIFTFQFIEGHEDEPFSCHYSLDKILNLTNKYFNVYAGGIQKGLIHPQWTWITAEK